MWNYDICGHDSNQFFFLDWVKTDHKKIAYASSLGAGGLAGPDSYVEKAKYYLNKFDHLSLRETIGIEQLSKDLNRDDIVNVLDPVFVCNKEVFDEAASEAEIKKDDSIVFAYILNRSLMPEKKKILEISSEKYSASTKIIGNPNRPDVWKKIFEDNMIVNPTLEELTVSEWLHYIKNSKFYVGDSYHGMCFAIIFHTPFLVLFTSKEKGSQRFESLLKLLDLEDRLIKEDSIDDERLKELIDKPIDWNKVDGKLLELKENSLAWLKNALASDKKEVALDDYLRDDQLNIIAKQADTIHGVRHFAEDLEHRLAISNKKMSELDTNANELRDNINSLKKEVDDDRQKVLELVNNINIKDEIILSLKNSVSFKIGRFLTWLPRKIRGGYRCLRDNGLVYTIKIIGKKITGDNA